MDKGIALPDSCQDFLSLTFANPIATTAVATTITTSILAISVRGSRSLTHCVSDTFANVVSFSTAIPSVSASRTTLGSCWEMCGGGMKSGEHGDIASHAGQREEGNWRAIGVANHVGGDSVSDCAWLLASELVMKYMFRPMRERCPFANILSLSRTFCPVRELDPIGKLANEHEFKIQFINLKLTNSQ